MAQEFIGCGDVLNADNINDFSVAFWVNFGTLTTEQYLVTKGAYNVSGDCWAVKMDTRTLQFSVSNSITAVHTGLKLRTDKWYHIVITYSNTSDAIAFYIDGAATAASGFTVSGSYITIPTNASRDVRIGTGYNGSGLYFKGKMFEVGIWNAALSASEITAIYNSGRTIDLSSASGNYAKQGNLVGYWKMDEGDGASFADSSTATNTGSGTNITASNHVKGNTFSVLNATKDTIDLYKPLTLNSISAIGSDTDTFLMLDGSTVKTATGANVTSYLTEEIQDIVGAMFTSNTETRISATYEDGDGTIDLVVTDMTADTNTQNTYTSSWVDSTNDVLLRLTAGGAGSGTQDIKMVAGTGITLTPSGTDMTIATTVTAPTNYVTNDADDTMTGNLTITNSSGPQLTLGYDANEKFTIDVADSGITTLATTDNDGGYTADFILDSDGEIELNSANGNIRIKQGSVETIYIDVNGSTGAGAGIKFMSILDPSDYFSIDTTTHGATTITTVDDGAAAANLTFAIDGAIALNGASMTVGSNVDFGDNDITNVDSLDTDKFSIAGGTEMSEIGAAVSGNSTTNLTTARTVKTYVDSVAVSKETFSFMKRFTCNSSTSKWVGGYRDNYYKSAEVWSLSTTKNLGGNYTDTTVSRWASFVYSDFTVANACTVTKFTCSGYQNNADEDIIVGLWKVTPEGDTNHSGTLTCAHIGHILFEANADTSTMHATQSLTSFQGTTALGAGDSIMVCGTDPGTGGTDGTYWWLQGAIEVTYD